MLWLAVCLLACIVPPARAQALGADLSWRSRATWRGLSRASRSVLQPAVYAAIEQPSWEIAIGGWWNVELSSARAGDHTLVGEGRSGLGEGDYWAQGAWLFAPGVRLTTGAVRYTFPRAPANGAVTSRWNTTEIYGGGEWAALGIEHELTLWADVDRVRGAFVEYTASRMLPLFPVRLPPTLVLSANVGASIGESTRSGSSGYYSRDGFRFADFSLGTMPTTRIRALPIAVGVSIHYQLARADAPAPLGSPPLPHAWWGELTLSVPGVSALDGRR